MLRVTRFRFDAVVATGAFELSQVLARASSCKENPHVQRGKEHSAVTSSHTHGNAIGMQWQGHGCEASFRRLYCLGSTLSQVVSFADGALSVHRAAVVLPAHMAHV
jgi:hypothetical protein